MVQKERKPRGRPRAYDPEQALSRAMGAFWDAGYAATSLDALSEATGMNRPSLYAAFGDKHALYLKALAQYWEESRALLADALADNRPLREGLALVYARALATYLSGEHGPRGCFLISTATSEMVLDADVRALMTRINHAIDGAFARRIRRAQDSGELSRKDDAAALGTMATATLYSLALRARAGTPRAELERIAQFAVDLICGPR
jgi:AcrR family transcriptional regulator